MNGREEGKNGWEAGGRGGGGCGREAGLGRGEEIESGDETTAGREGGSWDAMVEQGGRGEDANGGDLTSPTNTVASAFACPAVAVVRGLTRTRLADEGGWAVNLGTGSGEEGERMDSSVVSSEDSGGKGVSGPENRDKGLTSSGKGGRTHLASSGSGE